MSATDTSAYAGDIVSRLRSWRGLHLAHSGNLFEEAADEIERLRDAIRRLADQDATLTPEERAAIQAVIDYLQPAEQRYQNHVVATLRGLLERTK